MPQPQRRRLGRLPAREPKLPSERDWERSTLLEPRAAPRRPALIGDGGGLPFPPSALEGTPAPLDPSDPAVQALQAHLDGRDRAKRSSGPPWRRHPPPSPGPLAPAPASLAEWRLLARTPDEALFGRGQPPALVTMAVSRDSRRNAWAYSGSSAGRPLRVTREGIRASSWRLDPTREPQPQHTELRLLVTEQTFSGGQRAHGRVLAPDLHLGADQVVLTLFVTPRPGYQAGSSNPETPVRVALPEPLGLRLLVDGALVRFPAAERPPDPAEDQPRFVAPPDAERG